MRLRNRLGATPRHPKTEQDSLEAVCHTRSVSELGLHLGLRIKRKDDHKTNVPSGQEVTDRVER
jgi:hypothetical protein